MTTSPRVHIRTRAAAAAFVSLVAFVLMANPAMAEDRGDSGDPMSIGQVLLIFAGIPILVVALVWLLVAAPGWTRAGRTGAPQVWSGDPVALGGSPAADAAPAAIGSEPPTNESAGGASATW